jgi:hypothetical protein
MHASVSIKVQNREWNRNGMKTPMRKNLFDNRQIEHVLCTTNDRPPYDPILTQMALSCHSNTTIMHRTGFVGIDWDVRTKILETNGTRMGRDNCQNIWIWNIQLGFDIVHQDDTAFCRGRGWKDAFQRNHALFRCRTTLLFRGGIPSARHRRNLLSPIECFGPTVFEVVVTPQKKECSQRQKNC